MINKDINYYMSLPYEVIVWQEPDDTAWFARIPDLPGVMTHAEKWEDLPAMIEDAKRGWMTSKLKHGRDIPEPVRTRA